MEDKTSGLVEGLSILDLAGDVEGGLPRSDGLVHLANVDILELDLEAVRVFPAERRPGQQVLSRSEEHNV